jgi:hypothetical protein
MSIERAPRKQRDFTIITNAVLRDERMSYRARGILAYVLSLPDGAQTDAETIASKGAEGVSAVYTALKEMEKAGYLVRGRTQDEKGRWRSWSKVHEEPADGSRPVIGDIAGEVPPASRVDATDAESAGCADRRLPDPGPTDPGSTDLGNPTVGLTSGNTPSSQVEPTVGFPTSENQRLREKDSLEGPEELRDPGAGAPRPRDPEAQGSLLDPEPPTQPPAREAKQPTRATALPADWAPNDTHRRLAVNLRILPSVDSIAHEFRDYHTARGNTFKLWDSAFNTWLRNIPRFRPDLVAPEPGQGKPSDRHPALVGAAGLTYDPANPPGEDRY